MNHEQRIVELWDNTEGAETHEDMADVYQSLADALDSRIDRLRASHECCDPENCRFCSEFATPEPTP